MNIATAFRNAVVTVGTATLLVVLSGCGDDDSDAGTDAGSDAGSSGFDAGNGGQDAGTDAGNDAGVDAGTVTIPVRPADLTACSTGAAAELGTMAVMSADPLDTRLTEISGIAASRSQPLAWVHDDSGNDPNAYAVSIGDTDIADGAPLAIYTLVGVAIRDWEDIAIGPGPSATDDYIYLGDIGDKNRDGLGSDIVVYRFVEPTVTIPTVTPGMDPVPVEAAVPAFEALRANYPAGLVENADALFVDPAGGATPDVYVVTSGNGITTPNRVFRMSTATPTEIVTMELVMAVYGGDAGDPEVTAADISPDGSLIIMRSLKSANLWQRAPGFSIAQAISGRPCNAAIPPADAASNEGGVIGFFSSSDGYYTSIEADPAPLWSVPLL